MTYAQARALADALYEYRVAEQSFLTTRAQLTDDDASQQALADAGDSFMTTVNNLNNAVNTQGIL